MREPVVPTLDDIARDPAKAAPAVAELLADPALVAELSAEAVRALAPPLAQLYTAVMLRAHEVLAALPAAAVAQALLTADEVAERLGIAPSYVYELAKSGELRAVRFGKYVRFDPTDIDAFIMQHKRALVDASGAVVDGRHRTMRYTGRERGGSAATPETPGAQADRTRGPRGRTLGDR